MIPFLTLTPGRRSRGDRRGHRPGRRPRLVRPRPGARAVRERVRGATGARHAVGVGNGTDALAIALRAAGIGRDDEVITSPLSAAYTALAIMMVGARPVFADIDPVRLTIDPGAVAAAVTPRPPPSCPCTSTARPPTWRRSPRSRARHGLADRRRLLPGAPRHLRRPAGRQLRCGRGVQLLSDEESRRAR